tara:strand:+ start:46 stop:276 length:231 start_codon:yes stop_codon:yes gene_type:complete
MIKKDIYIEGTLQVDGVDRKFALANDGGYSFSQWGADTKELYNSFDVLETILKALETEYISEEEHDENDTDYWVGE